MAPRPTMRDRIFVQIPAYRDTELAPTLLDLYAKALHPDRLRVCVVWQRGPAERLPQSVRRLPNLELIEVPHQQSRGCNWARRVSQRRWRGEPYTLLLDSHQRFVARWDALAVEMYRCLRAAGVRKPLITAYLPSYDPAREPGGRKRRPYKIYPLAREHGILCRLTSHPIPFWTTLAGPVEADFVSLHFLFAAGGFNRDVPFDPDIYFFGDEVLTGVRAFLAGYDLFHPHVVIGWHCYDRASRVPHWDDHASWRHQNARSLRKIRRLLQGTGDQPRRSGARTLEDYEARLMLKLVENGSAS